jgi:hypothetical protein
MAMTARSSSRGNARVIWLAVHTTEGMMRAADLRAWASWPGSSHASCDETGVLMTPDHGFVPYERASWTLRNGNSRSENIEQCGWARWTRAEWLARPKLLDATARWLAERSRARGIPLRHLSPAEVRAGQSGVIGHVDYTLGTGDGSHTDPGKSYPWDVVLAAANSYAAGKPGAPIIPDAPTAPAGDDFLMALTEAEQRRILAFADQTAYLFPTVKGNTDLLPVMAKAVGELHWGVLNEEQGLRVAVAGLYAKLAEAGPGATISAQEIAAAIPDGIASDVVDELQRRLIP